MAGNRCTTIHKLHQKHGPIVQIGPHELSFCSIESIDAIYGAPGECNKAPIYDHLARTGVFNIRDPVAHKQRRRLLSHVFAQGNINDMEPNIREQIRKLMEVIDRHSSNAIDVRQWFRMLSMDVAGK
jgi:cytochrome P450